MVNLINSPFTWLATFFIGIFFCAWRMDKAVERLALTFSVEPAAAPKGAALIKNALATLALLLGVLYLLNATSFKIALVVILVGCVYYWREAYKARVLPLISAGMSPSEGRVFMLMQLLWLGPLAIALALFVWRRYSAT